MLKAPLIPILDPATLNGPTPRHDLHLHTDFTDGEPTVRAYVERAIELGLEHIGFPEHCNLKTTWLTRFVPVLDEERRRVEGKLKVHWGIEAKGTGPDGVLAATPEMLDAAEYVYGAFHSSLTKVPFPELGLEEAIAMEASVVLGMIRARSCHVVAHPGGLTNKYHGSFPNDVWERFAEEAGKHDVALELNPGYGMDVRWQRDTCIKHGCKVTLGSNAHKLDELGLVVNAFAG